MVAVLLLGMLLIAFLVLMSILSISLAGSLG